MDLIWIFLIVGLGLGGIMSVVFDLYSKKGSTAYSRSIFGIQSTDLITDSIVLIVGATLVFLSVVSAIVRDFTYPKKKPMNFAIETLTMATLSSLIIFLMTYLRGYPFTTKTVEEFGILFAKFGILHVLLQFSGFYSYIFPPK
jgi:hypothetical protein